MTHPAMSCDQVGDVLQDYLEQDASAAVRGAVDAHLSSCAECRELVAGLRGIARDASGLPALTPSRDLWSGIASRIDAPVVPISTRLGAAAPHVAAERRRSWYRPAVAAAALVVITAGTTHLLTRAMLEGAGGSPTVAATNDGAPSWIDRVAESITGARDSQQVGITGSDAVVAAAEQRQSPRSATGGVADPAQLAQGGVAVDAMLASFLRPADAAYDEEVARLRSVLTERRADLDSTTVAIVEKNLAIIDLAIQESRAALARDPASLFLNEQLNYVLEKKVELLRTAAAMPSRS